MAIRRRARSSDASEKEQIVPEAEMEILAVLRRHGERLAREIREDLAAFRPMSHASVVTLLARLESKGLVTRRKADQGKSFVYSATRAARPLHRGLLKRVMRRIFANDAASLVASLFDAKAPTAKELEKIR